MTLRQKQNKRAIASCSLHATRTPHLYRYLHIITHELIPAREQQHYSCGWQCTHTPQPVPAANVGAKGQTVIRPALRIVHATAAGRRAETAAEFACICSAPRRVWPRARKSCKYIALPLRCVRCLCAVCTALCAVSTVPRSGRRTATGGARGNRQSTEGRALA